MGGSSIANCCLRVTPLHSLGRPRVNVLVLGIAWVNAWVLGRNWRQPLAIQAPLGRATPCYAGRKGINGKAPPSPCTGRNIRAGLKCLGPRVFFADVTTRKQ